MCLTFGKSRRAFVRDGSLFLLAARCEAFAQADVTFGLMTDLHYADKPPSGTRHYRETKTKIREAVRAFRAARADFAVELGDYIDEAASAEAEAGYARDIEAEFRAFGGERHHVLGNHCVWTLTKPQFLEACGERSSFYSFDRSGFHFIVLDACFRADGVAYGAKNFDWKESEIPPPEREWLAADLKAARGPAIAFVHQRLDVPPPYGIRSGAEVRRILEESGKVRAVFQGHHHRNDHRELAGIHYLTLAAMIEGSGEENSAYCVARAARGGALRVDGFRKQQSWSLDNP